MGAKQSNLNQTDHVTLRIKHKDSLSTAAYQKKKKRSFSLRKSRLKYLSEVMAESTPDLVPVEDPDEIKVGEKRKETVKNGNVRSAENELEDMTQAKDTGTAVDEVVVEDVMMAGQGPVLEAKGPTMGVNVQGAGATGILKRKHTFQPRGRYDRSSSFYDDVDHKACIVRPEDYSFPFENLVLEGGGNKGLAYCGAVRYLEELGVMNQVKSLAGASAGAMFASLMAVGYSSYEIEQFLSERIDKVFLDASCGYFSLLPNILRTFGWNPGLKIFSWLGSKFRDKTGDADVTFQQLYHMHGKILCVVVTNLNQMTTEYCHPKTTPDMPVRVAIRMSMAIPGLFSAMKYERFGNEDLYIDGGMLCNYPIHCFDGWYLSMVAEDSFMRRLQPVRDIPVIMERNNRFGTYNDKTLGMLLYSDAEDDILRVSLERRVGCLEPARPRKETKLFIERQKQAKKKQRAEREHAKVLRAVDAFLKVLKKHNIDHNDVISRQELERAFKDETEFSRQQAEVLFGKDFTVSQAFDLLDRDDNGQIGYDDLVHFIEENGVSLQTCFFGYERKEIKNFVSFLSTLQTCLCINVQKLYVEERDLDRTVGINTGHVQTTDFLLEEADREFVVQRGYNSMRAFLRYYIVQHPDKVLKGTAGQPTSLRHPRDRASLRPPNIPDIPEASKCTRHP